MTSPTDDFLKHAHRVESRANALAVDMVRELKAVQERIMGKLATISQSLDWKSAGLRRRKAALEKQLQEVGAVLSEVYRQRVPHLLREASEDVVTATTAATVSTMNEAAGLSVSLGNGITAARVRAWFESSTVDGLTINDWLAKLETAARGRILSVGRQSLIEGLSVDATARMLRKHGVQGSVPGLKGLASTFLQSANGFARETAIEEGFSDVVTGWRHLGVLDGRACLRCGVLDGKVYALDQYRPALPLHWRCRCLYLPVTGPEPGGERPSVKHEGRTIHHRDGSTSTAFSPTDVEVLPASTTYQKWLERQVVEDPAFVRHVLGKTRFELFKAGELTLNRMVSHGRTRRLVDLV